MNLATLIRAMDSARNDMERAVEFRRGGRNAIRVEKDRLARKWQKAERQHWKFKERVFLMVEHSETELERQYCKLEQAAIVLQNVLDDGEGGENRGDINNYLVGYDQHFLRK